MRIGVLFGAESAAELVQEAQKAAAVVRLALVARPVTSEKDVPAGPALAAHGPGGGGRALASAGPAAAGRRDAPLPPRETLKAGKPVYSFSAALVAEGALVSNGPDFASIGEQAAELVEPARRRRPDGARSACSSRARSW